MKFSEEKNESLPKITDPNRYFDKKRRFKAKFLISVSCVVFLTTAVEPYTFSKELRAPQLWFLIQSKQGITLSIN